MKKKVWIIRAYTQWVEYEHGWDQYFIYDKMNKKDMLYKPSVFQKPTILTESGKDHRIGLIPNDEIPELIGRHLKIGEAIEVRLKIKKEWLLIYEDTMLT